MNTVNTMNTVKAVSLRVHIAHVGYEVQRVVKPLVDLRADRVYLITGDASDTAKSYWNQVLSILGKEYTLIEVEKRFSSPWSFPDLLSLYREIVKHEQSSGNQVYVNISTGTKVAAMVGLLSAMLWGTMPYYAQIAYGKQATGGQIVTEVVTGIITDIPVFRIGGPTEVELNVLSLLARSGSPLPKQAVIRNLQRDGFIPEPERTKEPAAYGQLNAILGPLVERGFIRVEGERKNARISVTGSGRDAVILFASRPD